MTDLYDIALTRPPAWTECPRCRGLVNTAGPGQHHCGPHDPYAQGWKDAIEAAAETLEDCRGGDMSPHAAASIVRAVNRASIEYQRQTRPRAPGEDRHGE